MRNDISDNIRTGQTLKYFRKRANLTQKDVAKSMLKSQGVDINEQCSI